MAVTASGHTPGQSPSPPTPTPPRLTQADLRTSGADTQRQSVGRGGGGAAPPGAISI